MDDPYAGRPSVIRRLLPSLGWGIIGVGFAVVVVFVFGFGKDRPGNILYVVVGVPVIVAGYTLAVVIASLANRPRVARARELSAGGLAFISRGNRFLTSGLERLAQPGMARPTATTVYATADSDALTLWQGRPAVVLARLPWASVSVIETTTSSAGGTTQPAIRLVITDGGLSTPLLLVAPISGGLGIATTPEAKWIAGELERLRG